MLLEFQQRFVEHQEDNHQIKNLQTKELAKVKHLVLLREQELAEKTTALKEATQQLDKLRNEMSRLRRQEELLSDVQVSFFLESGHGARNFYFYFVYVNMNYMCEFNQYLFYVSVRALGRCRLKKSNSL